MLKLQIKHIAQNLLQKNDDLNFERDGIVAINKLKSFGDEIVLSGNKLGLIMIADYILSVALSGDGNHVHLDENNFFDIADKQLVIEREDLKD